MNKVMTRTVHRTPSRPPVRRDTRRPGSTPHRTTPGGGTPRAPLSRATPLAQASPFAEARPVAGPEPRVPAQGQHPDQRRTPPHPLQKPSQPRRTPPPQPRPTDLFADRLLAVLSGERPVHSMLRHTVGRAYDELARLAERGPLRTRGTRPVVRDVGYYEPSQGALEAFARIGAGDQLRAMAFRLELGQDFRWRCTAVELGGPRRPHTADD
ncbi:Rv3235 family protein [Streptomyces sp. NBC_01451]|uniref:Rv3235 family protein n=1 Tax=Streptomyces sp. NBC_01451 TaxID=2903872 RepID=UPI002E357814|nr:Rv3235 family protein [Streptomyces sp. NBC_01451]